MYLNNAETSIFGGIELSLVKYLYQTLFAILNCNVCLIDNVKNQ